MSHEFKRTRKLREMFRRFSSRNKDRNDEENDEEEKEEKEEKVAPKQSPSSKAVPSAKAAPAIQRSASDGRPVKKPVLKDRPILTEPSVREDSDADQKSASDRKRHSIRLKYGITEKDEEHYRKSKDVEEFENVNAVARPAATKMRTHKMKWKKKDEDPTEVSARDAEKGEKSFADFSDETADDVSEPKSGSEEIDKTAEIKARESLTELKMLIIRIEELELANKKLKLQMKRLRKRLRDKDKKIEELTTLNAFLQKSSAAEEQKEEEPKPTPQQETVAKRGLEIMKRNHLLEDTVHDAERKTLCNFFEAPEPKPTPAIVMLIDKALSYAIDVILMRPDMFDDIVDNELRIFLLDGTKAKHVLLDVMLLHPEYVPRAWGGDVLMRRKQERLAEANVKGPCEVEDKTVMDEDVIESKPCKPKPLEFLQASPQPKLKAPAVKEESREKKSKSEKSPGERFPQRKLPSLPALKQATQPAKNAEITKPRNSPSAPTQKAAGQGTR